jgi:hypothetical protein
MVVHSENDEETGDECLEKTDIRSSDNGNSSSRSSMSICFSSPRSNGINGNDSNGGSRMGEWSMVQGSGSAVMVLWHMATTLTLV